MVGKENGAMSRVNSSGADCSQERRNYAHENIFLLELRARRLFPCASPRDYNMSMPRILAQKK